MDNASQIENAIAVLGTPTSDAGHKAQAFEFLNRLREDPDALHACTLLFVRQDPRASEMARMVCLEVINFAVHSRAGSDSASIDFLKDTLLAYVGRTYGPGAQQEPDPAHLQNKLSQTLTYLFVFLYRDRWRSFIDDFFALAGPPELENAAGVMLYLRVLGSIHDEIADMLLTRQSGDAKRNADLKDQVRAQDMEKVARSWRAILARYAAESAAGRQPADRRTDDAIVEAVFRVMGKWISWMDISLVVGQNETMALLLRVVGRCTDPPGREDKVRDIAIDTLTEICGKKMRPRDKMDMIRFLNLREIVSALLDSPPLRALRNTPRYDTDLAESVAKLVNTVVSDVVRALEEARAGAGPDADEGTLALADQHLRDFLPFLLRLLSDEYDEVSNSVISSLTDLLAALRRMQQRSEAVAAADTSTTTTTTTATAALADGYYSEMLPPILRAVIMKMRYDETSSWGHEDEQTAEAEFQELRKRLQVLQKSIEVIHPGLYIDVLADLIGTTFQTVEQQGAQMDWRDLDLALHELSLFGELALPNQSTGNSSIGGGGVAKKSPRQSSVASDRLVALMMKMEKSDIAHFDHPAIALGYLETCVRYVVFFEWHPEYIPRALENFVRLIHHTHIRVKGRSWYLFYRFVRQLRTMIGTVAGTLVQSIRDLLPIRAELPGPDADDDEMSSDQTDHSADALFTTQLYLYQAVGCVAAAMPTGNNPTPAETRAAYLQSVINPLFGDMEEHLPRARAGEAQATLQIHHIVMALGTLAYGVTDASPSPGSGAERRQGQQGQQQQGYHAAAAVEKPIADEFARAAEAILIALRELNAVAEIRQACRSAFSRLLGVLGPAVLQQLPQWIEGLLSQSSSRDEMAMFLRLLDQVVYGFKAEVFDVLDQLLTPLVRRCLDGLSEPVTGTDDEIQLGELRREYLTFLQIVLSNGLEAVFISGRNQASFETLIMSIIRLALHGGGGDGGHGGGGDGASNSNSANTAASRIAFGLMTRIAAIWGGPDVAVIEANPTAPSGPPSPVIPGFDVLLLEHFHPTCWEVLLNPAFRPATDPQARQLLLEIAGLQQMIYTKTGESFIRTVSKMGVADETALLRALTTSTDRKRFAAYLGQLLKDRR